MTVYNKSKFSEINLKDGAVADLTVAIWGLANKR